MYNHTYKENISVEEAVGILLSHTPKINRFEEVPLLDAVGRILARDMVTEMDNPPFDRSPIDGYACRAADIVTASKEHPVLLKVTEEIDAGQYSGRMVERGEAVRIMTGAPIPPGCDCCVMQENTDYGEDTVAVCAPVPVHGNYCDRGEDFPKGMTMLSAGDRLGSAEIANLAAMGMSMVPVYEKPRIALFTTGDELTEPGKALAPGKIYNSNYFLLAARLAELGLPPVRGCHIPDDPQAMAEAIRAAAETNADLILTTGGVSVGKKDILHETIDILGAEKLFWRVQLKPGMPTIFSLYRDIPIVSLSGNPFGALANMELLVRPMLAKMTGDDTLHMKIVSGIMADDFPKASKGRRFIRGLYRDGHVFLPGENAPVNASHTEHSGSEHSDPTVRHSSGVLASMRHCNCLVDIPAGSPALQAGDTVRVWMISPGAATDASWFFPKNFQPENNLPENHPMENPRPDEDTEGLLSTGPSILAISGVKNSGKTTLITKLIPILTQMGWRVATIKHDSHGFDPDVPGTDSYRHRAAGAVGTAIYSDELSMIIRRETITEKDLIGAFPDADLILLEGFKWTAYPKIEIVRKGNSAAPVCEPDTLIAIATDFADADIPDRLNGSGNPDDFSVSLPEHIPLLDLNRPEEIAQAIWEYFHKQ